MTTLLQCTAGRLPILASCDASRERLFNSQPWKNFRWVCRHNKSAWMDGCSKHVSTRQRCRPYEGSVDTKVSGDEDADIGPNKGEFSHTTGAMYMFWFYRVRIRTLDSENIKVLRAKKVFVQHAILRGQARFNNTFGETETQFRN